RVQPGQRLVIEGRLRMVTQSRPDGVKEKRAEFTLARLHPVAEGAVTPPPQPRAAAPRPAAPARAASAPAAASPAPAPAPAPAQAQPLPSWNSAPLVPDLPDDDDIPF
ncbi:MAG: single-stranded DNA-binding protein, partial [Cyanobacteriota bacterium]|nr:single-stranded DNA-binding protein [Cyanobacteriota bacterium]